MAGEVLNIPSKYRQNAFTLENDHNATKFQVIQAPNHKSKDLNAPLVPGFQITHSLTYQWKMPTIGRTDNTA